MANMLLLISYYDLDELTYIRIGGGLQATQWVIKKRLICHYSFYFAAAYRCGKVESNTNRFRLLHDSSVTFSLFADWMHTWEKLEYPQPCDDSCFCTLQNLWCQNAHLAWILGDKLCAPKFTKFALATFIPYSVCKKNKKIYRKIEHSTTENCALACYTREWEDSERELINQQERNFSAATMTRYFNAHPWGRRETQNNPCLYEIDHWYEPCGQETSWKLQAFQSYESKTVSTIRRARFYV